MNNRSDDKNRRVLLIDDNRAIHDDFRKILCPASTSAAALDATENAVFGDSTEVVWQIQFALDSAYQGQEGVLLAKNALEAGVPYTMAFVDLRMPPGWDGVETMQKIWAIDPAIQIVLCTAYSDYSWDEMVEKVGHRDGLLILKKPFDAVEAIQLAHALTEKWWLHQQSQRKLEELESRVAERTRELRKSHGELVEASRQSGMAEMATGVLHNVGNVLNSVNVASICLADSLKKSKAANLSKVVALLREHEADLGAFLTTDAQGKLIPGYLSQLAEYLADEQAAALKELAQLQKNIEHIKDIVTMQQSGAKVSDVAERVKATDLVEDALRMNDSSLSGRDIQILKEFKEVPPVITQKLKVLQILVNLMRNASQACDASGHSDNRLTLRVGPSPIGVSLSVSDNGVGILPENLTRIFNHGFTTKKEGHGFGLHGAALATKELGGALTVRSDGVGRGATFILELPLEQPSSNDAKL